MYPRIFPRKNCVLPFLSITSYSLDQVTKDGFPSLPITVVHASTHSKQLIHSSCKPFLISICVGQIVTQASQAVHSASGSSA